MVNIDDALAHSIFGRLHSVLISRAGQCPDAGLSQRARLEKLCWFRFFQHFSNSTPFDPPSRPREAQWKPHDLLLFLTWPVPEWPYLVNPRPFSTPAYLLLSGVDGERPVRLHPGSLARALPLPRVDEAEGNGGDGGAEHLHLPLTRVAHPEGKILLFTLDPPIDSYHISLFSSSSHHPLTELGRKVQARVSSEAKLNLLRDDLQHALRPPEHEG